MKRRHEDEHIQIDDIHRDERLYDEDGQSYEDAGRSSPENLSMPEKDSALPHRVEGSTASDGQGAFRIHDARVDQMRHDAEGEPALAPLFTETDAEALRARWQEVQTSFVDAPRDAVQQADALVSEAIDHLAELFRSQRADLEQQWTRGEEVSTEDLRLMLQRYRSFFDRLLSI